jgi:hypothetical protein
MAISPSIERGLAPVPIPPNQNDDGWIRLCEFTLAHTPELRQLARQNANPLCALFARTEAGRSVCDRGCGMPDSGGLGGDAGARHLCPFGMAMRRVSGGVGVGPSRWIGRRFPSAGTMHNALDRLVAEGFDEETILNHLPANPIVDDVSLNEATVGRAMAEIIPLAGEPTGNATAKATTIGATNGVANGKTDAARDGLRPTPREDDQLIVETPVGTAVSAVLEYLTQMNHLLASVNQPTRLCERFLKAVGVVMTLEQTAILVRRRVKPPSNAPARLGDELIMITEHPSRSGGERGAHWAPLSSHELGPIVFAERKALVEIGDEIVPLTDDRVGDGTVGLPLMAGGRLLGVWLARLDRQAAARGWTGEPARLMRLMAEMLANRLQHIMGAVPARHEPVAVWSDKDLQAALAPELTRAQRHGSPLLLLHLLIHADRKEVTLPVEALARALRARLRPYDLIAMHENASGAAWGCVLPHMATDAAAALGERIRALVEDTLDANGGLEERGLRVGLGMSLPGADTGDAQHQAASLATHARQAAKAALAGADPSAAVLYQAPAGAKQEGIG